MHDAAMAVFFWGLEVRVAIDARNRNSPTAQQKLRGVVVDAHRKLSNVGSRAWGVCRVDSWVTHTAPHLMHQVVDKDSVQLLREERGLREGPTQRHAGATRYANSGFTCVKL